MFNMHARARSVIRQFEKHSTFPKANLDLLNDPAELALVKCSLVGQNWLSQRRLRMNLTESFYLVDLASSFHSLWNAGRTNPALRFVLEQDDIITAARMQLVMATSLVICTGLNVLSIKALEEM